MGPETRETKQNSSCCNCAPSKVAVGVFEACLLNGKLQLCSTVRWLASVRYVEDMRETWLTIQGSNHSKTFHPKFTGCQSFKVTFEESITEEIE